MQIDLNNPKEFTLEGVRNLIASIDDSRNRQLLVTKKGKAFLSEPSTDTEGLALRLESFGAGNGYTGEKAAKDDKWVKRIYDCLKMNWPLPPGINTCRYIDSF